MINKARIDSEFLVNRIDKILFHILKKMHNLPIFTPQGLTKFFKMALQGVKNR